LSEINERKIWERTGRKNLERESIDKPNQPVVSTARNGSSSCMSGNQIIDCSPLLGWGFYLKWVGDGNGEAETYELTKGQTYI
jgi:hypothetical protein